ncbi:DNA-binding transcriptional LysR family regulator [Streptomyces phaeochromogenes]|uniref:hypothetical protein n=1 Tax=Streptomyces phaeochromogenes TaxID=1923 RepID=UPI002792A21A|nr:hypothetical protein [Streptomyces phaeochromogenes]MDQ0949318.1 DNA-binding transcriptional LysR family regulator [Streptomyces phaeochromogenes]
MSNDEQQPAEPAEQERTWTPGDIRRAIRPRRLELTPAARQFAEQLLALTEEYERARRSEIIAAGGDPNDDRNPLEYAQWIASEWAATAENHGARLALILRLADELTLDDLRTLRLAAEAAAAITPHVVVAAGHRGMKPNRIAEASGLTPSRIYSILREAREEERAIEEYERTLAEDMGRLAPPEEP